jgi:hypothetical protein
MPNRSPDYRKVIGDTSEPKRLGLLPALLILALIAAGILAIVLRPHH